MSAVQTIEVTSSEDGMRLDRWFKTHFPALGHGPLQKLLRTGQVRLDGGRVKANARVVEGQVIRVPPLGPETTSAMPKPRAAVSDEDQEFIQSLVVHRDRHVIVLNKPSGLATQGGTKTSRHVDGMLDALMFESEERPRLVHRLDRDTSGVLLLARSRKAATALTGAFRSRDTEKTYWALVAGVPRPETGRINLPLVKAGKAGDQRMVPAERGDRDGQKAETVFATIDHAGQRFAWLALSPLTGRTHQLRVHMAAAGYPIVGDRKYPGEPVEPDDEYQLEDGLDDTLHLHARQLRIPHPAGGMFSAVAPMPEHMDRTWRYLGFSERDGAEDQLFDEGERFR